MYVKYKMSSQIERKGFREARVGSVTISKVILHIVADFTIPNKSQNVNCIGGRETLNLY